MTLTLKEIVPADEYIFSNYVDEGFAYEVSATLECDASKYSLGELNVVVDGEKLGEKNNTVKGVNKFIFYATKSGLAQIKYEPLPSVLNGSITGASVSNIGEMVKESEPLDTVNIVAAVASIPSRKEALSDAVNSILDQVDRLFVYLNSYSEIPEFLNDKKIEVVLDRVGRNAAAAKFYWLDKVSAYYFSIDDDIVYPADYCAKTIKNYENNSIGAVVSYHGKSLKLFASNQKTDRKNMYLFENKLLKNVKAHVLGTGVMMVDTSRIELPLFDVACKHPRSIDLAVSIYLRKKGVARIVFEKEQAWLKQNSKVGHGLNEFKQLVKKHSLNSTQQVISGRPWVEPVLLQVVLAVLLLPIGPLLSVIDKNKKLKKLLRNPRQFCLDSKFTLINKIFV